MNFDYYQTGIKEATFSVEDDQIRVRKNDGISDWQTVSGEVEADYTERLHFDLVKAIHELIDNPEVVAGIRTGVTFHTSTGAIYQPTTDEHLWIQREKKPAINLVVAAGKVVGLQVAVRNMGTVIIRPGFEKDTVLAEWQEQGMLVTDPFEIQPHYTKMVSMRDGVKLATEIFMPADGQAKHSVILGRTTYGRQLFYKDYERFVQRGFVVVLQDVRGRNDSEGDWLPMYYEREDGQDTVEWIAKQDWSNQKVGMIGGSYGGYVQWAAASSGTPYLKALVSIVTAGGPFNDTIYKNGAPMAGSLAWFFSTSERKFHPEKMLRNDWDELMKIRPLSMIPQVGLGHEIPGFSEFMKHKHYDEFLAQMDWKVRANNIHVPALIQSGWFDDNGVGTTEAIRATNHYTRGSRKLILGPWVHSGNAQYDLGPVHLGENALRFDIDLQHVRWFEHFLNGVNNGVDKEAPVEYYTLNTDKWKNADQFPPTEQQTSWYLDCENGKLLPEKPTQESIGKFDYDPTNPIPHLIDVSQNELEFPNDYAEVEQRDDVLTFTSNELAEPMTITGWFKAIFYASSSAVNTDWAVRVTDVYPDGRSINIDDGVMNAIFYDGPDKPQLLKPGKVYKFEVETQKTSIQLAAGHQLRVDIASAANNLIFPNTNTEAGADGNHPVTAHQTIYSGGKYSSRVVFSEES